MLRVEDVVWTEDIVKHLPPPQANSTRFSHIVKPSKQTKYVFILETQKYMKSTWAKSNHLSDPYLSVLYNKTSKHKANKKIVTIYLEHKH